MRRGVSFGHFTYRQILTILLIILLWIPGHFAHYCVLCRLDISLIIALFVAWTVHSLMRSLSPGHFAHHFALCLLDIWLIIALFFRLDSSLFNAVFVTWTFRSSFRSSFRSFSSGHFAHYCALCRKDILALGHNNPHDSLTK